MSFFIKTEQFRDEPLALKAIIKAADIYRLTNRQAQYKEYLEKARTIIVHDKFNSYEKDDILKVHYELGEVYSKEGKIENALAEWEIILRLDPKYKDVQQQFNKHYSSRIQDFFKDILTSKGAVLTDLLIDFIKSLGFTVDSIQHIGEQVVEFYVSDAPSKWRDRKKTIISFWCDEEPMPVDIATKLTSKLTSNDVSAIYIISAGPVMSELRHLLGRKNVEIYDKKNLKELIDARKKADK